jgi:hypothetical protein
MAQSFARMRSGQPAPPDNPTSGAGQLNGQAALVLDGQGQDGRAEQLTIGVNRTDTVH